MAQTELPEGDVVAPPGRVRLFFEDVERHDRAQRIESTGLQLEGLGAVRWDEVRGVQIRKRRSRGEGLAVGVGIGGLVGLAAGLTYGATRPPQEPCLDCLGPLPVTLVFGALGTMVGSGPGAVVGAVFPGREWVNLAKPH